MLIRSVHHETRPELAGKVIAAGKASARAMEHLLGMDSADLGFRVKAVAWLDHALELSVQVGAERGPEGGVVPGPETGQELVFRLERRTEASEGLVETDDLVLYYRGDRLPEDLSRAILTTGKERLAAVTMHGLSELVASDPELGNPGLPMPSSVDEMEHPGSLLDTWGASDAYADFFAVGEVARAQLDTVDTTDFILSVQHGDAECIHVFPHSIAPIVWLTNYPWEDRIRKNRRPTVMPYFASLIRDQMLTTDLTETDVIMGNREKVRAVLARAAEMTRRHGRTLFFSCTCVPVVTGEDVESELKRWRADTGCPFLYLTVSARSMVNVFHDVLVARRMKAESEAEGTEPGSVNLVGFPERGDVDELRALLEAAGVRVNVILLPDLTVERVDRLPRAALSVYMPNQTWQHLYDQLKLNSKTPSLELPAPYGILGTREWLARIVQALDLKKDVASVCDRAVSAIAEKWQRVTGEASRYRLGLVIRGEETHHLTRPATVWGVPLVSMLEEMGFGLDVLIQLKQRKTAYRTAKKVHDLFAHPDRHTVKGFDSLDLLLRRLRESPCHAVCTYHFYDWRVTQSGKNLFSLQHLEMGMEGALRSARRLVGICRTPFFRRYARYLARTPEGLRVHLQRGT